MVEQNGGPFDHSEAQVLRRAPTKYSHGWSMLRPAGGDGRQNVFAGQNDVQRSACSRVLIDETRDRLSREISMENDMVEDTTTARPNTDAQNGFSQFAPEGGSSAGGEGADTSAASIADRARDRLTDLGESGKEAVAGRIDELADAVHRSGQEFAGKQDWIAQAIDGGAAQLNTLAASLRDRDVPAILAQIKDVARERPSLFLGASFAVGFALTRFAKIVAADLSSADLPTMPEVGHG